MITYEITDVSLKVTQRKIFRKETEEYFFENILINDTYALKHHFKSALGGVFFFGSLFVHAIFEPILNPKSGGWGTTEFFGAFTLLFIVRFFVPTLRIFIPTKEQGLIRLYMYKPSKKKVREFIYALEGKVYLKTKASITKSKYPYVV